MEVVVQCVPNANAKLSIEEMFALAELIARVYEFISQSEPTDIRCIDHVVQDGRTEDANERDLDNVRAAVNSLIFSIPRRLSSEEFASLQQKLLKEGWKVEYTFFSWCTDRRSLRMRPVKFRHL